MLNLAVTSDQPWNIIGATKHTFLKKQQKDTWYSGFITQKIHHANNVLHQCSNPYIVGFDSFLKKYRTGNPIRDTRRHPHSSAKNTSTNIQQVYPQGNTYENGKTSITTAAPTYHEIDPKQS